MRGRNIEIYVDNILVKSVRVDDLVKDLEEIFVILQRYGLKLNPNKCIFDVRSVKFLSYMMIERGIEVNPKRLSYVRNEGALEYLRSPKAGRKNYCSLPIHL